MNWYKKVTASIDGSKVRSDAKKAFQNIDIDEMVDATCFECNNRLHYEMAKIDPIYLMARVSSGHSFLMIDDWIIDMWEFGKPKLKVWHYTDPEIQQDSDYNWPGKKEGNPPSRMRG